MAEVLPPGNETVNHFSVFDIQYILLRDFLRLEVEDLRLDPVTLPRLGIFRI